MRGETEERVRVEHFLNAVDVGGRFSEISMCSRPGWGWTDGNVCAVTRSEATAEGAATSTELNWDVRGSGDAGRPVCGQIG